MKFHTALIVLSFGFLLIVRAEAPDEQYLRIYNLIHEADTLVDGGADRPALAKYTEALAALKKFKEVYPSWNDKVIAYRLNYVETKLAPLATKLPLPSVQHAPTAREAIATQPEAAPASQPALTAELTLSRQEITRLQQANTLLEARLREALSVQPTTADPRELSRAEERIRSLQKENELLHLSLDKHKAAPTQPAPRTEAPAEKKAITELKQKLATQKDTLASVQKENDALSKQVTELKTGAGKNESKLSQQLTEAQKSLAILQAANEKLRSDKSALSKQLADVSKPSATESVKSKELEAQMKAAANDAGKNAERLRKVEAERAALEQENKELRAKLDSAATATKKSDAKKLKDLEQENDELNRRVATLTKDLNRRSTRGSGRDSADLGQQIETLRARLDVLEARQIPYTPEELALLKKPEATLAAPDPKAGKRSLKEIPPGAGPLVSDARRAFEAKRFEEAEKKYLEVLRQDEKNIYTLANLAAIQLELNKLDEAEKNLKQALTGDPDDSFSLSMWGILKFRQKQYDDALDALSRSAKLSPDSAETHNYLGITLGQKGLRGPAETALRKALQLQPRNPDAHYNLAVVYATHQPPSLELARWHYDKAIAFGHPRVPDFEQRLETKKPGTAGP